MVCLINLKGNVIKGRWLNKKIRNRRRRILGKKYKGVYRCDISYIEIFNYEENRI